MMATGDAWSDNTGHSAGGVPMFLRIQDQAIIKALQNLETLGGVSLATFARKVLKSQNSNTSMHDDEPGLLTSDLSTTPEEMEEVGTLAQMKGLSWSSTDGVETVRPALHRATPAAPLKMLGGMLPTTTERWQPLVHHRPSN
jgi:hypothetical protein